MNGKGGRPCTPRKEDVNPDAMLTYKVKELSIVTEETIEEAVNSYAKEGWIFNGITFAMGQASRRPSMAFIFFIREDDDDHTEEG